MTNSFAQFQIPFIQWRKSLNVSPWSNHSPLKDQRPDCDLGVRMYKVDNDGCGMCVEGGRRVNESMQNFQRLLFHLQTFSHSAPFSSDNQVAQSVWQQ